MQQHQALEPIEQEDVPFHEHTITAVRLADGRLAIVLRWVCEILNMNPQAQVQRIERTTAIAGELVRVRVQPRQSGTKGGGRQTMPALTLRGFPVWILGINPNEVADGDDPQRAERIRQMIIAYQLEAVDVLYQHFASKDRLALPQERERVVPAEPEPQKPMMEPPHSATDAELATYYEQLSLWARWKADQHAHVWRGQMETWRDSIEERLESQEAISGLLPEILERLGPERLTPTHHRKLQQLVKQLNTVTGKPYPTIYDEFKGVFGVGVIEELVEDDWAQIESWFKVQIGRVGEEGKGVTRSSWSHFVERKL